MASRSPGKQQPLLDCTVRSERLGIIGYLAIYNRVNGRAAGGVRMVPDISLEEMQAAARTMAYKAGFIGFPIGGAKGAVRLDGDSEAQREELLLEYGHALSPLIKTRQYLPAVDMNTTAKDIDAIRRGAGLRSRVSVRPGFTHVYTAWSCFVSTLVALQARGIAPQDATYAVQGLGKVASEYVRLMQRAGAKLTAVSNRSGAIANPDGFDVDDLLARKAEDGEGFIGRHPDAQPIEREEVLTSSATVLLPAARAWAVHEANVDGVKAEIVVCASNVTMDEPMESRLLERGKAVVPDFVANCGGLLGSLLESRVGRDVTWRFLNTSYREKVARLLDFSTQTGQTVSMIAGREAEERMATWHEDRPSLPARTRRWMRSKGPRPIRTRRTIEFYRRIWGV